jgi:type IV pilus assembly protein PilV
MSMSVSKVRASGFSLIEVLIAIVILAVGLLGIAGLQVIGLKSNHSSYMRSQATFQIAAIFDRMRANRTQALNDAYDIDLGSTPSGDSLANQDLIAWKNELAVLLPSGDGAIACKAGVCTVTVEWTDLQDDGSRAAQQFVMVSQL